MFADMNILANEFTSGNSHCSITIICSYRKYSQKLFEFINIIKKSKHYTYQTQKEQSP